jgi:hypothetical protein
MARVAGKRPVDRGTRGQKLPNFAVGGRNKPFHFQHAPGSWELAQTSDGWRLIPSLSRLVTAAGVNGTQQVKGGHMSSVPLRNKAEGDWGAIVLGDIDAYMYSPDVDSRGGPGFFTLWEDVVLYEDGAWETTHDDQGYADWRWSLVVEGTVKPPRQRIWSEQERRLRKRAQRASRDPGLESSKRTLSLAEQRLEGLAEAQKAMDALSGPKPKRRARTVKRKAAEVPSE